VKSFKTSQLNCNFGVDCGFVWEFCHVVVLNISLGYRWLRELGEVEDGESLGKMVGGLGKFRLKRRWGMFEGCGDNDSRECC
jgi:hypothetical protein